MSAIQQVGHVSDPAHRRAAAAASAFTMPSLMVPSLPSGTVAACSGAARLSTAALLRLQGMEIGSPAHSSAASAASAAANLAGGYQRYVGQSAGSGQCVALVEAVDPAIGPTRDWKEVQLVQGNASLAPGTVIATFNTAGRHANATDGSSHAAIYLGQDKGGMQVLDQWAGKPAAVRTIPWVSPGAAPADSGGAYHVMGVAGQTAAAG